MEGGDSDSNSYHIGFPWKKNKAKICHLLFWEYLIRSSLKYKVTIQYVATLNGPGESLKAFLSDKSFFFFFCGKCSQNIAYSSCKVLATASMQFPDLTVDGATYLVFETAGAVYQNSRGWFRKVRWEQLELWGRIFWEAGVCDNGLLLNFGKWYCSWCTQLKTYKASQSYFLKS